MEKYTVLICDDNAAICTALSAYLKEDGQNVIIASTGEEALAQFEAQHIDIIILDIMLPGIDGYEVCRQIRKKSDVYIIMLSAKGQDIDRIVGLEIGADDYITKPVSAREISIRIKKAMSRISPRQSRDRLTLGELTVYPETYQAFVNDEEISLTYREISTLIYMMTNIGKVLTREHILDAVWSFNYLGDSRVIDGMIKRLRQKIVLPGVHYTIRTVYGIGYKLEELL